MKLVEYLKEVVERGGSDLHVSVNAPPMMRLYGELAVLERKTLSGQDTFSLLGAVLTENQQKALELKKNIDFALEIPHAGQIQRFRCNVFYQRNGLDGVFRVIPREIPTLKELNLPATIESLTRFVDGLILVTGPTGSGKSTTIAALIDIINQNQSRNIITVEDPIEHVHSNKTSLIKQRQVHMHTKSFHSALLSALRQDPDVILLGEMRDLDTIDLALNAASTGHLVFSTMHTSSSSKAIERLVEFYPHQRQASIRSILAECTRAVVAQQLIIRSDGWGRIPAVEIMVNSIPIANMIREFKTHQIITVIQTSKNMGMISMDDYLIKLVEEGKITTMTAYEHAIDRKKIETLTGFPGKS